MNMRLVEGLELDSTFCFKCRVLLCRALLSGKLDGALLNEDCSVKVQWKIVKYKYAEKEDSSDTWAYSLWLRNDEQEIFVYFADDFPVKRISLLSKEDHPEGLELSSYNKWLERNK